MRGSSLVIEMLNEILAAELTAINQYFVHGKMQQNWGYERLASKSREESVDEMHDADRIEAQLDLISQVGLENYLAQQIHDA